MSTRSQLVYALVFQVGWFVCITMGNILSFLYATAFLICHFYSLSRKQSEKHINKEILWVVIITCLGLLTETIYFSIGLLYIETKQSSYFQLTFPPLWLACIWLMFSLALRSCLTFLFNNPISSYLLCAAFVPVNYYAGAKLNTQVNISEPYILSLVLMTSIWLVCWWVTNHVKKQYFEELFNAN